MRQQDQHIVITGGGTGIGKEIAIRLASEGARISLLARRKEPLQHVCREIQTMGGKAQAVQCDVRDRVLVENSIAAASVSFGAIRAVIANSGIGGPNEDGESDRFDDLIQTNLNGAYYTLRAGQKRLIEDDRARHLIVVSSCLARFGVAGHTGYCASKAGLLGLTRALAMELAPQNIQVNAVCPGWVDTQMARDGIEGFAAALNVSYEEAYQEAMKQVPLGRMSRPSDVAGLVAWLVSEDSRGVTGQGLDINGGSWMG